jgi:hypothetical protein
MLRSSGVIFDPYKFVESGKSPPTFSAEGIKSRLETAKSVLKSSYSSAFIQRHVSSFSHRTLPTLAEDVFVRFMDAYRLGDVASLRSIVTEGLLEGIQQELKAQKGDDPKKKRQSGKFTQRPHQQLRSAFIVEGFIRTAQIVQMRHGFTAGHARSANTGYGQVTVIVQSQRKVVTVDSHGQIVTIDQETSQKRNVVEVPSLIVLEVGFADPKANWRIARIEEIGDRNHPLTAS